MTMQTPLCHLASLRRSLESGAMPAAFVALENTSNSPVFSRFYESGDLTGLINAAFLFAISAGGILAVLQIARGGFIYMGSADMWGEKAQAKGIIRDAIVGLLLLLSVYIILFQINPDIVSLKVLQTMQANPVQVPGATSQ